MTASTATSHDLQTPAGRLEEGPMHGLLGYRLAQAAIVTNDCFDRAAGQPLELRQVEYTILQLIAANPAATGGRIARALALTAPGVTVWLDRLESRGLVRRVRSESDRRATLLQPTPAGRKLVQQAAEAIAAAEKQALAGLTSGERQMLVELLHKVARSRPRGA